ncbi:MAG: HEAT repeat domain-containing protein [Holophagaceae bacterium]|nr:HEAT repeat domain-containing protein [Holophagaceae bacterium]
MKDFPRLAQTMSVALKALQMYTEAHPRTQEAAAIAHATLVLWFSTHPKLQFVVTGTKVFVDGELQETRSPHVVGLAKLVAERGISGFTFEPGVSPAEYLVFLAALGTRPQVLEEQGGFEAVLRAAGVLHIKVAQTRYQEIREGEQSGSGDQAPALNPAAPAQGAMSAGDLVKFLREALMLSITQATSAAEPAAEAGPGADRGRGKGGGQGSEEGRGLESAAKGGQDAGDEQGPGPLPGFGPADLSGLGPVGRELGLGEGMPSPARMGVLRQILLDLPPAVQLSLLASLATLPDHPAGLSLGIRALAGEVLASATSQALAEGISWAQLQGPIKDVLRHFPERGSLVRALTARLTTSGQDASQAELLLHLLEWEEMSLEAKLVKVLEDGFFFELTLEERLALLRELLDLRRFDEFQRIQDVLIETLRSEQPGQRLKATQTLAGVAHWVEAPGLPPGAEAGLLEALRAHFAWEPEPPVLRGTTQALESLLTALVHRGEFHAIISEVQELNSLCAFLHEDQPWRKEALGQLCAALIRPELLDAAIDRTFDPDRKSVVRDVHPYLVFLGAPMAQQLVDRLGAENDRTRRGRLVEAVRSLGSVALPALQEALQSPAWYLVRNALTLLPEVADADQVPAVTPLLRHPEPRVRRTAVRALWKLAGPAAEHALLARMKDTDAETLQEILFVLGQLRSESCVGPVTELAKDKRVVERLRIQALETLGQIGSPKSIPVFLECLRRKGFFSSGEPSAIRLASAKGLAALQTPEAREALKRVVEGEPRGAERDELRLILEQRVEP